MMLQRATTMSASVRAKHNIKAAAPANARRAPRAATALRVRAVLTRPSANGNGTHAANGHATTATTTLHTANGHTPQQQHHQQQQPLVGLPGNTHAKIMDCVRYVRARCALEPEVVVVLGSGLGALADDVTDAVSIPYADIPHFHAPGVVGHQGRLVLGYMRGVPALVLQGRFHYYEGHPMDEVILPIRVAKYLGCTSAVVTNAAGGINASFKPGTLMVIDDHINMIGANPLRGPNPAELGGPRFLDLSVPYDAEYNGILAGCAAPAGLPPLASGVYVGVSGPTYETRAEVRMFGALGADAVGMSTVPEVIAARHLGLRVAALSCITNLACGLEAGALSHDDVMVEGARAADGMRRLLLEAVPRIAAAAKRGGGAQTAAAAGASAAA